MVSKYNFRNIIFLVLVLVAFFTIFNMGSVKAAPSTIYVNDSGGDDLYDGLSPLYDPDTGSGPKQHIQPAIGDVGTDGTVNVAEGVYTEALTINRNVKLMGNGANRTTLVVPNSGDTAITITNGVDKVFISGFTITGAGVGVAVEGTGVTITDNNITLNENGITVAEGTITNINGNNIHNNDIGIKTLSDSITINYNRIDGNHVDISTSVEGIDATHNWWGSNNDPQIIGVKYSPWIYMTYTTDPSIILNGKTSKLTADFNNDYDGTTITTLDPADGHIPDGIPVTFTTDLGNIEGSKTTEKNLSNGEAIAVLTADEGTGTAHTTATLDNSQLSQNVGITETLYVSKTGNDAWSGTSPTFIAGTTGPKLSIQNAIETVNSGGIINIANGIYNEHNIYIIKSLTLNGADQKETIIDGTSAGAVFVMWGSSFINNLTIRNGYVDYCGGAITNNGDLKITNCTFTGNFAAYYGGAIRNYLSLTIINSTFIQNSANLYGGAIFNGDIATLTITGSTLMDNIAGHNSGGISNAGIITANFNRIVNNPINNNVLGSGTINAQYNWWGSNMPDFASIIFGTVTYDPWIILSVGVTPDKINGTSTSTITADMNHDSNHAALIGGYIPDGMPVSFAYLLGTVNPVTNLLTSGSASSTISALPNLSGTAYAKATADGYTVETPLTIDRTIPTPLNFDPVNNAMNIPVNKVIRVVFSESVKTGTAFSGIVLKDNYGVNIPIIKSFSPNAYNPSFSDLIITRTSGIYPKGYRYTLNIPINSIMDLAGNGLNQAYTTTFTIVTLPPTANPNIKGGYYNTAKTVTLTMNEPGTIYYTTNGATPNSSSPIYTVPIVISTTKTLKYRAKDLAGNFSPVYTQTYIIDKVAPTVLSTTPTNLRTGVSRTSTIIIKFREKIGKSLFFNYITIKNLKTNRYVAVSKFISLNALALKTSARSANTWYQITIPKAAIKDYAGNNLLANYIFRFKTGP